MIDSTNIFNIVLGTICILFFLSCSSAGYESDFKNMMDHEVGFSVGGRWKSMPHQKKLLDNERSEYIIHDRKSGCVWAFEVTDKDDVIQSWRYISDPSVCRVNWQFVP